MSLTINTEENKENDDVEKYTVTERLALTDPDETGEPQRAVPEGHADARWLYAIKDAEIPLEEAVRYGLVEDKSNASTKSKKSRKDD